MRSDNVTKGMQQAPHRSLFNALGFTKEELERPLVGIVSSHNEIVPGHMNIDKIVEAVKIGVSQISGGSRTSVGGYVEEEAEDDNSAQFDVNDTRTLNEVVDWLLDLGHVPSFCTACYREGRTGERFMSLVKSGQIANICQPNALMTLKEYLEDYATEETKEKGLKVIQDRLAKIPNETVRAKVEEHLHDLEGGMRDFRF